MTLSPTDAPILLDCLMDMAEQLMRCGAEVKRVEDTLSRMGAAYGAVRMDAFVITSSAVVTMTLSDGRTYTETRRVAGDTGTDFTRLEALNELSRTCMRTPLDPPELKARIAAIAAHAPRALTQYLGGALSAGAFTMFFGGSLWDALAASVIGLFITLLARALGELNHNHGVIVLVTSLLSGLLICLSAKLLPTLNVDRIMIGDIMLLIPGIAMTNAVRDLLVGDTISGLLRLIETLVWTGALVAGCVLALTLTGMGGAA